MNCQFPKSFFIRKTRLTVWRNRQAGFSDFLIHCAGIVFFYGFRHLQHLYRKGPGAQGDFQTVSHLYVVAGLYHPTVDADAAIVAGFIGNGAALDEPGNFRYLSRRMLYFLTVSFSTLLGLKEGTLVSSICMGSLVWGSRPMRALRSLVSKMPKPLNCTFSP